MRIWHDQALFKEPMKGNNKTPWHQDAVYWPHTDRWHQTTIWIALVVKGSGYPLAKWNRALLLNSRAQTITERVRISCFAGSGHRAMIVPAAISLESRL